MPRSADRSGQIVLILAFMLAGLVFLFILGTDIFLAVRGKNRLQNAGDAAALAAARWQGTTLNLIGELNLLHLAAACEGRTNAVKGIVALQERIAIAGPLVGFLAANEAAKRNGVGTEPEMTALTETVAAAATSRTSPTWPEKGADYAAMIRSAAAGGVAAGADNARILPAVTVDGGHPLYDQSFYRAAAARNWPGICRSMFGGQHAKAASTLLSWPGWGEIPAASVSNDFYNSEFYGVGVRRASCVWNDLAGGRAADMLMDAAQDAGLGDVVTWDSLFRYRVLEDSSYPWYFYDLGLWHDWWEVDPGGALRFPLLGSVKEKYNVAGAAAACRVVGTLVPLATVDATNSYVWTAAAKPFGEERGRRVIDVLPEAPLVLPSFRFTRLIPLSGVGEANLGAAERDWVEHVRTHVPEGILAPGCRWCRILDEWESPGFTQAGGEYLSNHAHDEVCEPPGHGPGPGGGTHYAH